MTALVTNATNDRLAETLHTPTEKLLSKLSVILIPCVHYDGLTEFKADVSVALNGSNLLRQRLRCPRCGIPELNATLLKQADECNTTKSEQKALQ